MFELFTLFLRITQFQWVYTHCLQVNSIWETFPFLEKHTNPTWQDLCWMVSPPKQAQLVPDSASKIVYETVLQSLHRKYI